jgi:hypothetical protein
MSKNEISPAEAMDLVSTLFTERTLVCASLFAPSGFKMILKGRVDSVSRLNGLVVSIERPPSPSGWISVPLHERDFVCSYGDKREFAGPGAEDFMKQFGDTLLSFSFPGSNEHLFLTFNL